MRHENEYQKRFVKKKHKNQFFFVKWPHDVNGYLICQMRDKYPFVFKNNNICTLHVWGIIILFQWKLPISKLMSNFKEIWKQKYKIHISFVQRNNSQILLLYTFWNILSVRSKCLPHNSFKMLISNTSNILLFFLLAHSLVSIQRMSNHSKVFKAAAVNYTQYLLLLCSDYIDW